MTNNISLFEVAPVVVEVAEGPAGPQGPQGPQGEVGPQGPVGDITPEAQGLYDATLLARNAAQAAAQAAENFADGLVASPAVGSIEVVTTAQYDALTPVAGTLYVIED